MNSDYYFQKGLRLIVASAVIFALIVLFCVMVSRGFPLWLGLVLLVPAGLGVTEQVTSPTYTIVNEYLSGRLPLFHFDMYRLDSADDLFDIGWEDYLARGGVCAVEWSENVEEALSGAIRITIHKDPADENVRTITIEGGERFADLGV